VIRRHANTWCLLWLLCAAPQAMAQLHHDLQVSLEPGQHLIEVTDTIRRDPAASGPLVFYLHPGLEPELATPGARLTEISAGANARLPALNIEADRSGMVPRRFQVQLPAGQNSFTLSYRGVVQHALQQQGEEYARGFQETPGSISEQGVFLAGSSFWVPTVDGERVTFDLTLRLPQGWRGMTQGDPLASEADVARPGERWRCLSPQEEIYLIAGRFHIYEQKTDGLLAMALLRQPDPALAQKYLDTTDYYVKLYSELLGAYPYSKFALVENFWETGYGMPSFTLLGPKVIRFPFILHSSYPHEILHNWWGNGVYVDYERGNWAEGLTSYLADHLIKEQRGQGVDYRRTVLQKYTDYVGQHRDFPLTGFRSRHSASTEAVGYGKTLMLFHMLRLQLGDQKFIAALRHLYQRYSFRVADFEAVQRVFSETAGRSLQQLFKQWVDRPGAPLLRVAGANARLLQNGDYVLSAVIEQIQDGEPYRLQVPVAVQMEGQRQAYQTTVSIKQKRATVELTLPGRPLTLAVDPEFDVFRRLHRAEVPPSISHAMGAERLLIVLPSAAPDELKAAYQSLAASWQSGDPERISVAYDRELDRLPDDRAVWLFGWRNSFREQIRDALSPYDYGEQGDTIRIEQTTLRSEEHAVLLMARQKANPEHALGWLAADRVAALPGLGRKLPHYGRYSYLAFTGDEPDNVLKGQWPVVGSPMSVAVIQEDGKALAAEPLQLAPRTALVAADVAFMPTRMQRDVDALAAPRMAGRGLASRELDEAAEYIASQFRAAGLQPGGDEGAWFQQWQEFVVPLGRNVALRNVIGILPGSDPARAGESLVIGAHYDHFGRGEYADHAAERGRLHPGADDNASGVAVMLELARVLDGKPRPRTIVFVAFTGEETGRIGSRYYVQHEERFPADRMMAMLNLDTVGRLGDNPVTVFGTATAEEWVHILRGASYVTGVSVRDVADDFGSSDQTSFIEAGVPAVQLFGSVHEDIHRPGDTLDKIDIDGMIKVGRVLEQAVEYLAERAEPLQSALASDRTVSAADNGSAKRRVSFGTVPDFAYKGDGVRVDDVRPASPAAQAGLRKGDVIIAVNDAPVRDMRQYSEALKQLKPGDEIRVRFLREGVEQVIKTRVISR